MSIEELRRRRDEAKLEYEAARQASDDAVENENFLRRQYGASERHLAEAEAAEQKETL